MKSARQHKKNTPWYNLYGELKQKVDFTEAEGRKVLGRKVFARGREVKGIRRGWEKGTNCQL